MQRLPLPCSLRRQDCLVGGELERRLSLELDLDLEPEPDKSQDVGQSYTIAMPSTNTETLAEPSQTLTTASRLSRFEEIFTSYPPVLEAFLLHVPTPALLDLYHTSRSLRSFLRDYPLAWKNLSFRLLPASPAAGAGDGSGFESPSGSNHSKRPYALDTLLRILAPMGTRLTRLDLDNTSVSGASLRSRILEPRRATLVHLSVRGCKDVSVKYHLLPFLQEEMATPLDLLDNTPLALKSLYAYRCRHHRRRPYLPSSLMRRDSDSQPTHQLIELCHIMGIWTDTAWCPTPGPRCLRRKDYYNQRIGLHPHEVWVPFDRLWRSQNFIGRSGDESASLSPDGVASVLRKPSKDVLEAYGPVKDVHLWESQEYGWNGEALGMKGHTLGEGREVPAHQRKSHTVFVEGYKCDSCGDVISERCEQCSVRMHCMGCRKTLCPSCAFDRPLPKRRRKLDVPSVEEAIGDAVDMLDGPRFRPKGRESRSRHRFWWAPGAHRSPNLMNELVSTVNDSSDDEDDAILPPIPPPTNTSRPHAPQLAMSWCCLEPTFSGGGGIMFIGAHSGDHIRASPLPKSSGYEDPAFVQERRRNSAVAIDPALHDGGSSDVDNCNQCDPCSEAELADNFNVFPYLEQKTNPGASEFQVWTSPRSLCQTCFHSTAWKETCAYCLAPICIDHEIKTLKARRCGFQTLSIARANVQQTKAFAQSNIITPKEFMLRNMGIFYAKWKPIVARLLKSSAAMKLGQTKCDWETSKGSSQYFYHKQPSHQTSEQTGSLVSSFMTETTQTSEIPFATSTSTSQLTACPLESPSCARPRSQSLSALTSKSNPHHDIDNRNNTDILTPTVDSGIRSASASLLPTNAVPKPTGVWIGCGKYFCSTGRSHSDNRPLCLPPDEHSDAKLNWCDGCSVLVCASCSAPSPQCPCSFCSTKFLCPNCTQRPDLLEQCRWIEEERARLLREQEETENKRVLHAAVKQKWEESKSERENLDLIMLEMLEFWQAVES